MTRWFPHARITISRPGTGVSTPVFRVGIDEEAFWARLGEEPGERRDGEVAAHRLMATCGLPVPDVVRYEAAPPELDRSISLTMHITGVPISTLQPSTWLEHVAVQIGHVLARINAIELSGFGWAYASEHHGIPTGQYASRDGWVQEYRDSLHLVEVSGALPKLVMRAITTAVGTWASEPDRTGAWLVHGDLDASHLYVDPERGALTGIIDFGELRGADQFYDLGHLLLHDGEFGQPELFTKVLRGYGEAATLPLDAMTRIRSVAIAIGIRALAIQLGRPPSPYREWLQRRLITLAKSGEEGGDA